MADFRRITVKKSRPVIVRTHVVVFGVLTIAFLLGGCGADRQACEGSGDCPSASICEGGFCIQPDEPSDAGDATEAGIGGDAGDASDVCRQDGDCQNCQPDCSELECGADPVCGASCGTCNGISECDAGQCTRPDNWFVVTIDGERVYSTTKVKAQLWNSTLTVESERRKNSETFFQFGFTDVGQRGWVDGSCARSGETANFSLELGSNVPSAWSRQEYVPCSHSTDSIDQFEIEVSGLNPVDPKGSFELRVSGNDSRAGETMTAKAEFLDPELDTSPP